jgi:hypothetical protein
MVRCGLVELLQRSGRPAPLPAENGGNRCSKADVHDIYQQAVVVEELLKERDRVTYEAEANWAGKLPCPYPRCKGS